MNFKTISTCIVGAIVIASITISLVILHRASAKFLKNEARLQRQNSQLAELAAEHQRLENRVGRTNSTPEVDRTAELEKLRNEAEALQKQTNELGKELAANRRSWMPWTSPPQEPQPDEYYEQRSRISAGKKADAELLTTSLEAYALDHQGQYPPNFDQLGPYLAKRNQSLTGTNEFEILYQGSLDELTNVPPQVVALVRERQAWQTPSGKWAKVYGMVANCVPYVVESDDNFQSWDAAHIIPPPSASQ